MRACWIFEMGEERTQQLINDVRSKSKEILSSLEKRQSIDMTQYRSWIRGIVNVDTRTSDSQNFDSCKKYADKEEVFHPSERCQFFDQYGFIIIPSFSNNCEVEAMKSQMRTLVDENWFPGEEKTAIFRTVSIFKMNI